MNVGKAIGNHPRIYHFCGIKPSKYGCFIIALLTLMANLIKSNFTMAHIIRGALVLGPPGAHCVTTGAALRVASGNVTTGGAPLPERSLGYVRISHL
jgi:hypothetical protein